MGSVRPTKRNAFIRFVIRLFLKLFRISSEGMDSIPKYTPLLFVVNHPSFFDPFLVAGTLPKDRHVVFVGKAELASGNSKKARFLRWLAQDTVIFVDRDDKDSRQATTERSITELKCGRSVVIFSEGTLSAEDGVVNQGASSAIDIARMAGVPIVPIGISGTRDVLPPSRKSYVPRRRPMRIRVSDRARVIAYRKPLISAVDRRWRHQQMRHIMEEVASLSGKRYVDMTPKEYAKRLLGSERTADD